MAEHSLFWSATKALAIKEFLCLWRDKHGLAALFLMPTLFILVMTLILQDAMSYEHSPTLPAVGIVNQVPQASGHQKVQADLAISLPAKIYPTPESLRQALFQRKIKIGIVLQTPTENSGQTKQAVAGVLPLQATMWVDEMTPPAVVAAVRGQINQVWGKHLPQVLGEQGSALMQLVLFSQTSAQMTQVPIRIQTRNELHTGRVNPATQRSVPGWLALGMFFVVLPLAAVFVRERQEGTLRRLQMLHVPLFSILMAKCLCYGVVNVLQCMAMMAVGYWLSPLFGAQALILFMDWAALWVMILCTSLAAIGLAMVIAAWSRTIEQASTVGGATNVILGAVGGIMVPKMVMPVALQGMTDLSPLGWAYEGLSRVFLGSAIWSDWLPYATGLLMFGLVMLLLAAWRLRAEMALAQS